MTLPLHLQMEIDISAQAHSRDVAEGFAKLRAELLPEPVPDPQTQYLRALMEAMRPVPWPGYQNHLGQALGSNPFVGSALGMAPNQAHGGLLGISTPWF